MTRENVRVGFARLAIVAAWIVAIPWLFVLAGWSVRAFQATNWNWDSFKWSAILVVPVCKLVSWSVKIFGWVVAGFFPAPTDLSIKEQAILSYERDRAVLSNIWLILCWFLAWQVADFAGELAMAYGHSPASGRIIGLLVVSLTEIAASFVLYAIVDEILIRKILIPSGVDPVGYELRAAGFSRARKRDGDCDAG
jgi:hypothetical protein